MISPPSGCIFRTRCPDPSHECLEGTSTNALIKIKADHWVDQCCVNCH